MEEPPQLQNMTASSSKFVSFVLYFEFEYRKSRTIKRDIMLMLTCATKCSNLHKSNLISGQNSQLNTSLLFAVQPGAVVPHLKRGTIAVSTTQIGHGTIVTYLTVGSGGGIYTSSPLSQQSSSTFRLSDQRNAEQCSPSLFSIGAQKLSSFPCDFPINP